MQMLTEMFARLSELVPLWVLGAVFGIFMFGVGVYVEGKITRKFGRALMIFGFLTLATAVYVYFH